MNTAVVPQVDLPTEPRASITAALSCMSRDVASLARTAWEGVCSMSKASLLSGQDRSHAYRSRMRRL